MESSYNDCKAEDGTITLSKSSKLILRANSQILTKAMELWEQISRQRVRYIIDSYELYGDDIEDFNDYLDELLIAYAPPQIELAIVETIVASWLKLPPAKGLEFIQEAHARLKTWEGMHSQSSLCASQFQQITGLDPTPVFGQYHNAFSLT